jgi:type II secretory pathway component PulC
MLFGAVQRDRTVAAPTGVAMKLLGVAAGSSHTRGYAVLQVGGKDIVAIREGGDIVTGISLAEVHRDRIVLTRNGVRETLAWPGQSGSAAPLIPKQNVAAGVAPGSTVAASSQLPASVVVGPAPTKAERDRLSD